MSTQARNTLYGVIGEFDSANALMAAARKIREAATSALTRSLPTRFQGFLKQWVFITVSRAGSTIWFRN